MPISIQCPNCLHAFTVPDAFAGKSAKCPGCREIVPVPSGDLEYADDAPEQRPAKKRRLRDSVRSEHTHQTKGSFLSGFGLGSGVIMGILFVVVGVPILICAGCVAIGLIGTKRDSASPAASTEKAGDAKANGVQPPSKEASNDRDGEIGKETLFGSLGVTVDTVRFNTFAATTDLGRTFFSDGRDSTVVVRISLRNHDPNKLAKASAQSGKATLTDEHGNVYSEVFLTNEIGLKITTDGSIPRGHYIEFSADKAHADALVYQKPVPGAKTLTLAIDAEQYGGKGKVRYVVGRDVFSK